MTCPTTSILILLYLILLLVAPVNGEGFVHDETLLPAGITKAEAEHVIEDALSRVLTRLQDEYLLQRQRRRNLLQEEEEGGSDWAKMTEGIQNLDTADQAPNECNTIIYTASAKELREEAINGLKLIGGPVPKIKDWQIQMLDTFVLSRLHYDLQVWKVCGRCSDFGPGEVACRSQDYGYQANHSGLLIAPFDVKANQFYKGTIPVNFYAPAAGTIPSETHFPTMDPQVLIAAYVSATTGAASIMIDYIGCGESQDYYRSFLNYQAVVTATIPLLWQAEKIVSEQSNCASALADSTVVFGYSEGGYASVAIADALYRMGKEVISMHAGGGPYRVSTVFVVQFAAKIFNHDYDPAFFLALMAAGLSSTNQDATNYGKGQDFLADDIRDNMVAEVQISDHINRKGVNQYIAGGKSKKVATPDEVISMLTPAMIDLMRNAVDSGEEAPCITSVNPSVDKICEALIDIDVVQILEEAPYPMYLCHSIEDNLVPYANVPDVNANPNIHLKTVKGRHTAAAVPCAINSMLWYANPLNLKYYKVKDKTSPKGCGTRKQKENPQEEHITLLRKQ